MHCRVKLTHVMKVAGSIFYTDMNGDYWLDDLCLKLCYKDILDVQEGFGSKEEPKDGKKVE